MTSMAELHVGSPQSNITPLPSISDVWLMSASRHPPEGNEQIEQAQVMAQVSVSPRSGTTKFLSSSTISEELLSAPARSTAHVYEVWPQVGGRNRFLCKGRCITGPSIDFWYSCCAWSTILIPSIFYFAACTRCLWTLDVGYKLLVVATAAVFVVSIVSLLLTSCSDPGILPRRNLRMAVEGLEEEICQVTGCPPLPDDPPTHSPLTAEQNALGYRWCNSCQIIRPPRSSHCRDCDNCVLMFDHHCPFVGNCVGKRKYNYFSTFLASTACLGFAVVMGFIIYTSEFGHPFADCDQRNEDTQEPFLWLIVAVISIPSISVVGLAACHICLAGMGLTTREALRPESRSVSTGNSTLFASRGPSLVHARDVVHLPLTVI